MSDRLVVKSHRGEYTVQFDDDGLLRLGTDPPGNAHFIIDDRVATLHAAALGKALASPTLLRLEATEAAKSFDRMGGYLEHFVRHKLRRSDVLIAIGGGIIQDITCFIATTLLRGVEWRFYPTTLLAQADSCIGSKSSINLGSSKNLLGTFYPPSQITITTRVLATLDARDMRSGVGEMLKVHAIDAPTSFDQIAADYERLFSDSSVMARYISRSLELKRHYVEEDEFDSGPRNVMNYGHSFGHAIESATAFAVPHGIAVTLGMDMANYVAARLGRANLAHFDHMHPTLKRNYADYQSTVVPLEAFFAAIAKDKKNVAQGLRLILPDMDGRVGMVTVPADSSFRSACADYLTAQR